jgi:hypothetical protein
MVNFLPMIAAAGFVLLTAGCFWISAYQIFRLGFRRGIYFSLCLALMTAGVLLAAAGSSAFDLPEYFDRVPPLFSVGIWILILGDLASLAGGAWMAKRQ